MKPENLKMNEVVKETNSPEKEGGSYGVEVAKGSVNTEVVNSLQQLETALLHDTPVTVGQILGTEKALDSIVVDFYGEEMTIEKTRKILEENEDLWKEIECGNLSASVSDKLTYVTPHIAELLLNQTGNLVLRDLTYISDSVAKILSAFERDIIIGLTSISDTVAERLSHYKGRGIFLDDLTSISDIGAEYLSKFYGDHLGLRGLTSLSDTAAEHLSKHNGVIWLSELLTLSDNATRSLALGVGEIYTTGNLEQVIKSIKESNIKSKP